MKVTCVSLYEPYASLMRVGAKKIETRPGRILYRGPLLICAGLNRKPVRDLLKNPASNYQITEVIRQRYGYASADYVEENDFDFGHAVALVNVVDCKPVEECISSGISETEVPFGDYTPGRFGWITEPLNIHFTPFPVMGKQGRFQIEAPNDLEPYLNTPES